MVGNWFFAEVSIKIFKDDEQIVSPQSPAGVVDEDSTSEEFASATGTISSVSELESIGFPKRLSFTIKQLEMALTQRTYDLKVSMK